MHNTLPKGFTTRPGSLDDIPIAVDLFNIYSEHFLGVQSFSDAEIRSEWTTPKFKPETDIQTVFNPEGELVGYVEVWTIHNPPVHPWVWLRVHPEYLELGIDSYLLDWAERRASQALALCPEDVRVAFWSGTVSTIEPAKRVFEKHGMKILRHSFRMLIEMDEVPPEPLWPDGLHVRTPEDPEAELDTIYRVDNEAFRDHFGHVEQPFEEGLAEFSHWFLNDENHSDPSLWFMAMDGDEVAGLALCLKHDHEDENCGHIESLAVRRPWRKRGLGLALLRHAFGEYYQRGFKRVSLGVDAQNLSGALRLYKKAGMHVQRQFDLYEKELRPGKEISVELLGD